MPETKKLSLVAKLAEACRTVGGLEKKGTNKEQGYKFLKAADVAKAFREELFDRHIVIMTDEELPTWDSYVTQKGGTMRICYLSTHYHVIDGESGEERIYTHHAQAFDTSDKAIWKCKTQCLKYFLRGMGLVPDEKDDAEADSSVDKAENKPAYREETGEEFDQRTELQTCISPYQIQGFDDACKRTGKTEEEILAFLGLIGHKRIEHILKSEFQQALKWANTTGKPSGTAAAKAILKPATKSAEDQRTAAMKKLFGTASEYDIPEDDVKRASYEKFGVDSMTKLNAAQLEEMAGWVKEVAAQV